MNKYGFMYNSLTFFSVSLGCGGSSSDNNTYIVQTSTTSSPSGTSNSCTYTICPCSTDICRIRYDFTTMVLASQQTSTPVAAGVATDSKNLMILFYSYYFSSFNWPFFSDFAIGDCVTDQFSITSPGTIGSPTICGYNTGQHMILDTSGSECQNVNAFVGASTTTTRQWDIYVTQV